MIISTAGARPNFVKMTPLIRELNRRGMPQLVVHTGQHTDPEMSDGFFKALGFPEPDIRLQGRAAGHAAQTAVILQAFEKVCLEYSPQLVIVSGDVNATLACALAAAKLNIPVAHVEAGLRSFDKSMPEEINRILTDHVSELLFATEQSAVLHLRNEGIPQEKIHLAGNTMIDTLQTWLMQQKTAPHPWEWTGLQPETYAVATLHRPENVDHEESLKRLLDTLEHLAVRMPVIFPVHPRTHKRMAQLGLAPKRIRTVPPLGYSEFIGLISQARLVLTDSGGLQEETSFLGVPCLTLRKNTEKPVTVEKGTNRIIGTGPEAIIAAADEILAQPALPVRPFIEHWDGKASLRIADVVQQWYADKGLFPSAAS